MNTHNAHRGTRTVRLVTKLVAKTIVTAGLAAAGLGAGVANAAPPAPPPGPGGDTGHVAAPTITLVGQFPISPLGKFTVDFEGWDPATLSFLEILPRSVDGQAAVLGAEHGNGLQTFQLPDIPTGPYTLYASDIVYGGHRKAWCDVMVENPVLPPTPAPHF